MKIFPISKNDMSGSDRMNTNILNKQEGILC